MGSFFDLPQQWSIHYKDLTFNLKPFSFKHTGLFPEQAVNWDWFSDKIKKAGRPVKVLNLFAYTGGATLAAAAAGAAVTHVDASKGTGNLGKGKRRFLRPERRSHPLAGGRPALNSWSGRSGAEIIMTPSSWIRRPYGRGPKGEIWKIEDSIHPLIRLCSRLLSQDPLFFLVNSYTTGLAPAVLTYLIATELKRFQGRVDSQEIGLPVTSSGLVLPCGASGRWEAV